MLKLTNVQVRYPSGQLALDAVSLDLQPGNIYGLVGMNGAGKSTLFKAIMGFISPSSGSVQIAGGDIRSALRRNLVAYVPQSEEIDWNFPVLVEDVVMMGRYGHMNSLRRPSLQDREVVRTALERVQLQDYADRQIGELSGGQKKRVFIARALAQGSKVILLDEPFTGVDIKTEEAISALLRALAQAGNLLLVSTHNLGSVPNFCNQVILLNNTIIASGSVASTFTRANLSRAFGGMLRHLDVSGGQLHKDSDERGVTVLTDDERPLVMYGDAEQQQIVDAKQED